MCRRFHLHDHKLALGEAGVEQGESLELYNVTKKEWFPLLWSMPVGPVLEAGQIFLMRYKGVSIMDQFDNILCSMQ